MKKFVLLCAISLAVAGITRADSGAVIAQAPVITGGQGTVTKDKVNVRARADKNAELVAQLTKNERVEVLDTKGDWLKITLPASAKCYVATKFIKDGMTTGDAINIRCGPGTNFKDIGKLAKGEKVRGDVLFAAGKSFLGGGELLHESETEVVLFAAEVDGDETAAEMAGGVPTDLAAEAGSIARRLNGPQLGKEFEEHSAQEVPIFRAAGEEGAQPKLRALHFVNIDDG